MVHHLITHLQRNRRLRNEYAEKPLAGMKIDELETILVKSLPELQPPLIPIVSGDFGLEGYQAEGTITPDSIKSVLASSEHPKRSSEIAAALNVPKEVVDEVIDREGSGLRRGSGGWVTVV